MQKYDVIYVLGRFQIFHNGHDALMQEAFKHGKRVVVLIGSSFAPRRIKNPFKFQERAAFFKKMYGDRVTCYPIRDYLYSNPKWKKQVRDVIEGDRKPGERVAILGHLKDASSDYLTWFPQYGLVQIELKLPINATDIRNAIYEDTVTDDIVAMLPPKIIKMLGQEPYTTALQEMATRYAFIKKYRKQFENCPYGVPIFITVDAVVMSQGCILMVKRAAEPGKGLWAFPGGFLESGEFIDFSTIRELEEETGVVVQLRDIRETKVFDHPERSERGHTVTHASRIDPQWSRLPKEFRTQLGETVKVQPFTYEEFELMSEEIFEDHWHVGMYYIEKERAGL